MKNVLTLGLSAACLGLAAPTVPTALAQSFNVEWEVANPNGVWTGAPSASFDGAADQSGTWNVLTSNANAANLTSVTGAATPADLSLTNASIFSVFDDADLSGDLDRLLGDTILCTSGQNTISATFTSLLNGSYTVVVYACSPLAGDTNLVDIPGADQRPQQVDGGPTTNALTQGVTHSVHTITITNGQIRVDVINTVNRARIAGIQLRYHGADVRRLYVDDTAPGGNGSSWANALRRLDDAIIAANLNGTTAEIWVAQGTYRPSNNGDRGASFVLKSGLNLYGGFVGTETSLSQRGNPLDNVTNLTGEINSRDADDNVYHVVEAVGVDSSTILDGFYIRRGYANGGGLDNGGAGLFIDGGSPQVRNCSFRDNFAFEGGAVTFRAVPSLARFSNCDFINNSCSSFGGAVYFRGTNNTQVVFGNCRFIGNAAGTLGGAVYSLNGAGYNWYMNCEFNGNSAGLNGGALLTFGSFNDTRIDSCTFTNNTAGEGGGVVATAGSSIAVRNSIFWGNTDTAPATDPFLENLNSLTGTISVTASCVQGMPGNYPGRGPGCITTNPLFADPDGTDGIPGNLDDDLALLPGSPCIDAAHNTLLPNDLADVDLDGVSAETLPIDLARNTRRLDDPGTIDTGVGPAPIADMGAREYRDCPADFNEDGFLDFFDYDDYVACFEGFGCPPGKTSDFNGDGFSDFFDYDEFVTAFNLGC
jgi:predicted outer membrane repeat protein